MNTKHHKWHGLGKHISPLLELTFSIISCVFYDWFLKIDNFPFETKIFLFYIQEEGRLAYV